MSARTCIDTGRIIASKPAARLASVADANLTIVQTEPATVKSFGGKKAVKPVAQPTKRLSALNAAAQVLAGAAPMTTKEMIEAMAVQGLWTSPGGKTPHATLYSAILREITTKGDESRFVKSERGRFGAK
jgi:HB1, ASXL, restriction endonuclease HTH domain